MRQWDSAYAFDATSSGRRDDSPPRELGGSACSTTVELAARISGGRRASLLLPDAERRTLRVAAARGIPGRVAARVRVRLGEPVAGVVAQTGRSLIVNDRDVIPAHRSRGYQTGAFISVPVALDDDARGVLNVADPVRPEGFQDDDLARLEALAQKVSADVRFYGVDYLPGATVPSARQLRRKVIQAQEAERQRIARDLHDEAGHVLTAAVLRLDLEIMRLADDPPAIESLRVAREQLVECSRSLHRIAYNLRPRVLEDFGLQAALRSLAGYTMELTDLQVTFKVEGTLWPLDEAQELAILRVVQEALTNVRKHAQATRAAIVLRYQPRQLTVQIQDDGIGLGRAPAPVALSSRTSLGISGMRERVELLGGTFSIRRASTGGTRITATLPRDAAE